MDDSAGRARTALQPAPVPPRRWAAVAAGALSAALFGCATDVLAAIRVVVLVVLVAVDHAPSSTTTLALDRGGVVGTGRRR